MALIEVRRAQLELAPQFATGPEVPSPCSGVCRIETSGLCAGCMRSLVEIGAWSAYDADARRAVWAVLPGRYDRIEALAAVDRQSGGP